MSRLLAWIAPVVALVYARPLFLGEVFFRRDIARFIHPIYAQTRARLAAGDLPLWTRGEFGGMAMLGDVTNAVLYPPNLAALWLSPAAAITALIVGHHLLSALGAAVLLRCWGASDSVAAAFGLCFSLSGYAMAMDNSMTYLVGMSWGPWVLFALHRLVERPSPRRALPLSLIYACLFTSGELQFTYLSVLFSGAYVLVMARPLRASLLWLSLAGVLALCVSAVQLFPLVPLVLSSTRTGGLPLAEAQAWALHPLRIAELWSAHPFGVLAEQSFWGQALVNSPPHTTPWANGLYVGAALPVLMLCAPFDRRTRFLLGLLSLSLLLALGPYTFVDRWFRALLPLWSAFRYPEKLIALVTLAMCLCAGRGLTRVLDEPRSMRARGIALGATLIASCAASSLWLLPDVWLNAIAPMVRVAGLITPEGALSLLRESASRSAVVLLCATLLLMLGTRSLRRSWLETAWAVLIVTDVAAANIRLNELAPPEIYTAPMTVADAILAREDASHPARFFRVPLPFTPPPGIEARDLNLANQHWLRQTLAAKSATEKGLRDAAGYSASMSQDFMRFWQAVSRIPDGRALDLMAVRYVLDSISQPKYPTSSGDPVIATYPGLDLRVVARARPTPMARVVYQVHRVASQNAAFAQLAAKAFDARNTAIVEGDSPLPEGSAPDVLAEPARFVIDGEDEIVLEARASRPGLLVVAAAYEPSWEASVDQRPAAMVRVNAVQQGVWLPAGTHRVRLRYTAPGLGLGGLVTVATLLSVLVAWIALSARPWSRRESAAAMRS